MPETPHATQDRTANPYWTAQVKEWLRLEYERGRQDGYQEAVKMMRRAEDVIRKGMKRDA